MPSKSLLNRATLCFAFTLISATAAQAGVRMNAMCLLQNKDNAVVKAFNPTKSETDKSKYLKKYRTNVSDEDVDKKFRIASISKILTTHWAIAKLGPEYRFETKIYVTPGVSATSCNLHFEGDMDPYMGRDMLNFVFPQIREVLKERKCAKVDTISYDENFRVLLDVMNHQREVSWGWNNPASLVKRTDADFKAYLIHRSAIKHDTSKVGPISKERYHEYLKDVPFKLFSFKSRPLHMILRDFNKYSFNYPPEILFQKLGGAGAYVEFIQSRLGLTTDSVEMYNGSGYPVETPEEKSYNLVSCSAIVEIIRDLDNLLANTKASRTYQLADVMAVGGPEEKYSTFRNLYMSSIYQNSMVAKTGSADLTITFGGMLSTKEGHLYFAVLTRPDGGDADNARFYIRDLIQTVVNRNTLTKFPYVQIGDMSPTDKSATLVEIKAPVAAATAPAATEPTTSAIFQKIEHAKTQVFLNLHKK